LTADAVAASNSIEGFKVSTVDVEDLLGELHPWGDTMLLCEEVVGLAVFLTAPAPRLGIGFRWRHGKSYLPTARAGSTFRSRADPRGARWCWGLVD
jgi:hypothetical protein